MDIPEKCGMREITLLTSLSEVSQKASHGTLRNDIVRKKKLCGVKTSEDSRCSLTDTSKVISQFESEL